MEQLGAYGVRPGFDSDLAEQIDIVRDRAWGLDGPVATVLVEEHDLFMAREWYGGDRMQKSLARLLVDEAGREGNPNRKKGEREHPNIAIVRADPRKFEVTVFPLSVPRPEMRREVVYPNAATGRLYVYHPLGS